MKKLIFLCTFLLQSNFQSRSNVALNSSNRFSFFHSKIAAKSDSLKNEKTLFKIKTPIDFFEVDNLENIFCIHEAQITKYLTNGKIVSKYSNLKLGNIKAIDVMNPLKILVYYKDYQQLVFLDNQLSENSETINLEKLGYEQTELVCASANNSFWLFNKQNNELIRFNENSKKIHSTGNLAQLLKTELHPTFLCENNGNVYLNCPNQGIFVFDIFGTYIKTIGLTKQETIKVNDNFIYYKLDSTFCSYNTLSFEKSCKILVQNATNAHFFKSKLYVSSKNELQISSLLKE